VQNIQYFVLEHATLQRHHQRLSHALLEPTPEMIYHQLLLIVIFAGKDITVQKHSLLCIPSQHPVLKEHTSPTQEKAHYQTVKLVLSEWFALIMQHAH
jgi:hypothetical protein